MPETDISVYKLLLISVMKQAIVDALLHKKPKPPSMKYRRYGNKKSRMAIRKTIIFATKNYQFCNPNNAIIPLSICNMVDKIFAMNDKEPKKKKDKAYNARQFLTDKNKVFCEYNELLGIEPTYASEKINGVIKLYDKGNKNILRELRQSIDLFNRASIS
jgi:hypothetical protein